MTSPADNPTIREQLDAIRPESNDLRDVEVQEAARAIEQSQQWRELFNRQQSFDRDVSAVMQSVDIPDGLQSRLLESLLSARLGAGVEEHAEATTSPDPAPLSRRRWLSLTAAAAGILLVLTTGWLLLPRGGSLITLDEARQLLPTLDDRSIDLSKLPMFDESFTVALPSTAWERTTVTESELKGLDWTGDDRHDGAIYEFQVNRRIHGYLVIIPASRIAELPKLTRMSSSPDTYEPVPNVAWVDPASDLAYICFVDQGDLPTLQRLLYPQAA